MYWRSGSLTIFEASTSSSDSACRRHAFGLRLPFSNALAATFASVDSLIAVLGHVALDLHREELGREHQPGLAVPGADAPLLGQRVERARRVLVEADHDGDLGAARQQHRVRGDQRRAARRAAVLDVDERDARQAEHRHRGVGVARGVRAASGEVDLSPSRCRRPRARRGPRGRPSPGRRRRGWRPNGMDPQPDDRDVRRSSRLHGPERERHDLRAAPAPGSASTPSPSRSAARAGSDSVSLASTRTSPGNSTYPTP